jgi:hypothetical protein
MKKISLLTFGIALGVLAITSCSKDEPAAAATTCCTLSVTFSGTTMNTKYCKVDDKTVSISVNGAPATNVTSAMMNGMTADQFMAAQKTAGCK